MVLVIIHDNGICGQEGFSEETIKNKSEVPEILDSYRKSGITVINHFIESSRRL